MIGESYARVESGQYAGQIINDPTGWPQSGGLKPLGYIVPDWIGSFATNFSYKRFSASALFDMRLGSDFFSWTMWHSYYTGAYNNTVDGGIRENGVIGPGVLEVTDGSGHVTGYKPNDIRMGAQDYYGSDWIWNQREYSVLDGTFVKFRELSFSYSFKFKPEFFVKDLKLSLTGRNLAILYRSKDCKMLGIDPETQFGGTEWGSGVESFNLPGARSFGLKVQLNF